MSAGKVMLGTDGNPLRSADGKIVLADDLYPMVPTQQVVGYGRTVLGSSGCAASSIWSTAWGELTTFVAGYYLKITPYTYAWQSGIQIKFNGNAIDWARVKKITLSVTPFISFDTAEVMAGRITKSMNNSEFPAGTVIRDDWETVYTTSDTGPLLIEWDVNGVEPTSLEVAVCLDGDTCPVFGKTIFALNDDGGSGPSVRIVYNLAT